MKTYQTGSRIVKQARGQKIALAVASVIAQDRAHAKREEPPRVELLPLQALHESVT